MSINKIDKTETPYIDVVDQDNEDPSMVIIKNLVDKINEIIDEVNK